MYSEPSPARHHVFTGHQRIHSGGTPEEALEQKRQDPGLILVGEVKGAPIPGFDLENSPTQILCQDRGFFREKMVVQRASTGVQGALASHDVADEVLLASYVVSAPTARYILARSPERVSIVAMGIQLRRKTPEDEWCARYFAHLLGAADYDHNEALREILFHETTQKFLRADQPHFPAEDPILCLQPNIYDFSLKVDREGDLVVVRCVKS